MWMGKLAFICRRSCTKFSIYQANSTLFSMGRLIEGFLTRPFYSNTQVAASGSDDEIGKTSLAKDLATLIEESIEVDAGTTPMSRIELKRLLKHRIKKQVKEQYFNGKYHDLMEKVIANPKTLHDAYDCLRVNSNVNFDLDKECIAFQSLAEELSAGTFNIDANVFHISTKGAAHKEALVLPNLRLKVVQEAIKIVLEVVFMPHFSRISHSCRSGRGHFSALKYICKDVSNPNWWFTLAINKKLDTNILTTLISTMEAKIEDPSLYSIIRSMFTAQVLNLEFGGFPKGHGLPQEGVLSPILMNIYLDQFDRQFYQMTMRFEAIDEDFRNEQDGLHSKLRNWFRRQMKDTNIENTCRDKHLVRIHCCRFMDEIFFAVSGPKDVALALKSEMTSYLRDSLHLGVDSEGGGVLPCTSPCGIRFLGALVMRSVVETPTVRAVHKLKEKVELFALQKRDAWDSGTVRIGKKWLAYGLKKVKESEIEHLADRNSVLSQISSFRKGGMETDHWYKILLKVWMQDINAKYAKNEEFILSKCVAEPALPKELRDSFYEFQKRAQAYVSSETASITALLPDSKSSSESLYKTELIAPVNNIWKRLLRYRMMNSKGISCASRLLIMQDSLDIVNWFSGLAFRWLRWYSECRNFSEIKLIICNFVRKSCIRTLAMKYRIHETEIEKKFDSELSRIPSLEELETKVAG